MTRGSPILPHQKAAIPSEPCVQSLGFILVGIRAAGVERSLHRSCATLIERDPSRAGKKTLSRQWIEAIKILRKVCVGGFVVTHSAFVIDAVESSQ